MESGYEFKNIAPLHHAAQLGHGECLDALLSTGADPLQRTRDGSTAAHIAASQDRVDVLLILLRFMSSEDLLDARDAAGLSVLDVARRDGASAFEQELLAAVREREAPPAGEGARLLTQV